jgi:hypothetical protein
VSLGFGGGVEAKSAHQRDVRRLRDMLAAESNCDARVQIVPSSHSAIRDVADKVSNSCCS